MTTMGAIDLASLLGGREPEVGESLDRAEAVQKKLRARFEPGQAAEMLRAAKAKLEERHGFKPGDLIRYKRGLTFSRKESCGGIAIFLRWEKPSVSYNDMERGLPLALYDEDCVVGVLQTDGSMSEYYNCSRYYEPWKPENE